MPLPTLTPEQRSEAAARAAAARKLRAQVRADLKASSVRVSQVVERSAHDDALAKLKVSALLEAIPGIGKVKATSIMERLGIAQSRRLRGLGPHQIDALKREFG
ncbi:MAG: integration host factor, actinobacterial type [Actinomycetes bacterium]